MKQKCHINCRCHHWMSLPLFKVMLFFPDLSQQLGLWLKRSSRAYPIDLFWTWKPAVSATLNVSAAALASRPAVAVTPDDSWVQSSQYTVLTLRSPTCSPSNLMHVYPEVFQLGSQFRNCLSCAKEQSSKLSTGWRNGVQNHLGCIFGSWFCLANDVLYLSLLDSPSSRLSQTSSVFFGSQELSRDCSFIKPLASTPGNKTLPIGETFLSPRDAACFAR